jgi:hypothetical protein
MSTNIAKEFLKRLAYRYTSFGRPYYPYGIEPIQLATIINELERLRGVRGNIVEIGVARGMTTRLICEHLIRRGMESDQTFFALDTFSSFTADDLQYEVANRSKSPRELVGFAYNDIDVWRRNFARFSFITAVQADCGAFDYAELSPIKFAFLDVDLYRPTAAALPRLYDCLVPEGVIFVDDVQDDCAWDGAYQAYMEFCSSRNLAPNIVGRKGGLIYKTV